MCLSYKDCKQAVVGLHTDMERWGFGCATACILFCKPTPVSLQQRWLPVKLVPALTHAVSRQVSAYT